jgi:hypothetical protein
VTDTLPAQLIRTQRFTLGAARSFQISPDGGRVAFLRSGGGGDPLLLQAEFLSDAPGLAAGSAR